MWYLIKRGPRPSYHRAPFHPVIICDLKRVAKWEAGNTRAKAWVWTNEPAKILSRGWLLERWEGLDIDYFPVVSSTILPDGTEGAFAHDRDAEPWTLLRGAVWWSNKKLPECLVEAGVIYPPDRFSRQTILDSAANDDRSGICRATPSFWPEVEGDDPWQK